MIIIEVIHYTDSNATVSSVFHKSTHKCTALIENLQDYQTF